MTQKHQKYAFKKPQQFRVPATTLSFKSTAKRIDCDQLLNTYLQFSLAGTVKSELEQTKNWIKSNGKSAKKMIGRAQKDLKRVLEGKVEQANQIMSPQYKSITKLLLNTSAKNSPPQIFNRDEIERIISQCEEQKQASKKKDRHLKKVNQYLKLISNLERRTGKQYDKNISVCPTLNNSKSGMDFSELDNSQSQESAYKTNKCKSLIRDINSNKQNKCAQSIDEDHCQSYNRPITVYKNDRHVQEKNDVNYIKLMKKNEFHPFLQRNLRMLYESKKKVSNSRSKLFNFSRVKKETYY